MDLSAQSIGLSSKLYLSDAFQLRPICRSDNAAIAALIRDVLTEFGAARPGFAWADPQLDSLYEFYHPPGSLYLVAERDGAMLGGAGIAPLEGGENRTCELQKMYLAADARGLGIGDRLMVSLIEAAQQFGYRQCYLETMCSMAQARALYRKHGFSELAEPMGDTGHGGCDLFYLKSL